MKRKQIRILLYVIAAGIILATGAYLYVNFKPHRNIAKAKPDAILSSEELFTAYAGGTVNADSLYTGKVVQIDGTLTAIEDLDSMVVAVFVFDTGIFGDEGIRCDMDEDAFHRMRHMDPGGYIILKGLCEGYNSVDVLIGQCTIIE